MAGRLSTSSASLMNWCSLTQRRSTKARAPSIRGGHPDGNAALHDAAAEAALHGCDSREASRRAGGTTKGPGDRGKRRPNETAVVEAAGVVGLRTQRGSYTRVCRIQFRIMAEDALLVEGEAARRL